MRTMRGSPVFTFTASFNHSDSVDGVTPATFANRYCRCCEHLIANLSRCEIMERHLPQNQHTKCLLLFRSVVHLKAVEASVTYFFWRVTDRFGGMKRIACRITLRRARLTPSAVST